MPFSATLLLEPTVAYIFVPSAFAMMFFVPWWLRSARAGRLSLVSGARDLRDPVRYTNFTIASVFATYRSEPINAMPKGECRF